MRSLGVGAVIFPLLALALASVSSPLAARADETHDYEIAANDGYGLEDCLSSGAECGRVVADAWCEAHGHGHALSFGPSDGTEEDLRRVSATQETYPVRCGD